MGLARSVRRNGRRLRLTDFEPPTKIRWTEQSKNIITVPEGGYDLAPEGEDRTRITLHNALEGHGFGRVIMPLALRGARKDADAFGKRIKAAVEAS